MLQGRITRPPVVAVIALVVLALLLAAYAAGRWWAGRDTFTSFVLEQRTPAPALRLTGVDGNPFDLDTLDGRVVAVVFAYSHCPDVCPLTLSNFANAVRQLPESRQRDVAVVVVAIDPVRDTPEVLGRYLAAFDRRFLGATGSVEQVDAAIGAWGMLVQREPPRPDGSYFVSHPAYSIIVDRDGAQRLLVPHTIDPSALADDLSRLIKEKRHS